MLQSLFSKISIHTYFVINMCALFSRKNIPHFLKKKRFILRKHDFSRKLEGGTGLQGVSSNLNVTWLHSIVLWPRFKSQSKKWEEEVHASSCRTDWSGVKSAWCHTAAPPLPCPPAGWSAWGPRPPPRQSLAHTSCEVAQWQPVVGASGAPLVPGCHSGDVSHLGGQTGQQRLVKLDQREDGL